MRTPKAKRPKQGGFTLMEVLVSLVLGAIAMIGVIALYRASTNASSFSRRSTEASILAQDKLERLRTEVPTVGAAQTEAGTLDETGKVVVGAPFTRKWDVATGGAGQYFDIAVEVSWLDEDVTKKVIVRGRRFITP